eukprot:COSAG01_NODE_12386_length_1749_cov_1.689091_2_plen_140_part_00
MPVTSTARAPWAFASRIRMEALTLRPAFPLRAVAGENFPFGYSARHRRGASTDADEKFWHARGELHLPAARARAVWQILTVLALACRSRWATRGLWWVGQTPDAGTATPMPGQLDAASQWVGQTPNVGLCSCPSVSVSH